MCPMCGMQCTDDVPIVVDKLVMGILASQKGNSKKKFFQITSGGEICDDSASESESESDDEEGKFEDEETP